ncbi:LacI family DNA-binding transcriptional regulator [soil metagenome]
MSIDNQPFGAHRPITLHDVAKRAGVSVSTASNALTGARHVGQASIERVLLSAAELGYRRNEVARSLRTGLRNTIGLVIPDVTNPFFADVVKTVENLSHEIGWSVLLCNTDFDSGREAGYLAGLTSSADGILLFSTAPDEKTVRALVDMGVSVVAGDEILHVEGMGGVFSDNVGGGRLAAEHLIASGGRRFGLIEGPHHLTTAAERAKGFVEGLEAHGRMIETRNRVRKPYSLEGGREALRELMQRDPTIDAVFASTDMQAIGAIFEGEDLGFSVPGRLMVCGFDGISWSERIHPSLTTLQQDTVQLATRAFEMLIDMVVNGGAASIVTLPVELIERESTRRTLR